MKVVGQCVVGPNEKYLEDTLKEFVRLTDDSIAATCNATDKEIKLLNKYDIRHYEDNREWGKFQPNIKEGLLKRIKALGADWIVPLDADETVPTVTRSVLEEIAVGREACYFNVINLWNDREHYIRTGPAAPFWNIRYYKVTDHTRFMQKPVHCGNAPAYYYDWKESKKRCVPHILLHTGLMLPSDRQRKAERYNVYDPNGEHKGSEYYDVLTSEGTGTEYNQEVILQRLYEYCK